MFSLLRKLFKRKDKLFTIEKVRQHLLKIANGEIKPKGCGICEELYINFKDWYSINNHYIKSLWVKWPHYSGEFLFPVPHNKLNPIDAWSSSSYYEAWGNNTYYGQKRLELCKWLSENL